VVAAAEEVEAVVVETIALVVVAMLLVLLVLTLELLLLTEIGLDEEEVVTELETELLLLVELD